MVCQIWIIEGRVQNVNFHVFLLLLEVFKTLLEFDFVID